MPCTNLINEDIQIRNQQKIFVRLLVVTSFGTENFIRTTIESESAPTNQFSIWKKGRHTLRRRVKSREGYDAEKFLHKFNKLLTSCKRCFLE